MPNYCIVPNCKSLSKKGVKRMFHMLPNNQNKAKEWLKIIGLNPEVLVRSKSSLRVCGDHFQHSSYRTMRKLKEDALPSLRLNVTSSKGTPTSSIDEEIETVEIIDETSSDSESSHAEEMSVQTLSDSETTLLCYDEPTTVVKEEFIDDTSKLPKIDSTWSEATSDVVNIDRAAAVDVSDSTNDFQVQVQAQASAPEQLATNSNDNNFIQIDVNSIQKELEMRSVVDTKITKSDLDNLELMKGPFTDEQFLLYCKEKLGSQSFDFIELQMLMKTKNKRKRLLKCKKFLLSLYYQNPRAYGFLKQFVKLPSVTTLRDTHVQVNAGSSISPQCVELLKTMIGTMRKNDKNCILGIASIAIKKHMYYDIRGDVFHGLHVVHDSQLRKPAKFAHFLIAKGLFSEWQIPIAYTLDSEKDGYAIAQWVDTVIFTLMIRGLNVCALVVSQNDDFKYESLFNLGHLGTRPRSSKGLHYIFDVKHLIKKLRDDFMDSEFRIDYKETVKWSHIVTYYNVERRLQTHITPNLTSAHIKPDKTQMKSTQYAEDLFSRSVAKALKLFVRLNMLDYSANATAGFIERVNDLSDLFGLGPAKHNSANERVNADEEEQHRLLHQLIEYFQSVANITDQNNITKPTSIADIVMTLGSVKKLWIDLKTHSRSNTILVHSFNAGFMEDFLRAIRTEYQRANSSNLTAIEFHRAFSKYFVSYMLKNARLNTSYNLTQTCSKLHDFFDNNDKKPEKKVKSKTLSVGSSDYRLNIPETNRLRFVAGYLMSKALDNHRSCRLFMEYLKPQGETTSQTSYMTYQYVQNGKVIVKTVQLPAEFIYFVMKMEEKFVEMLQSKEKLPKPSGTELIKAMGCLMILPCKCFPVFLIKKLFVRLRIYHLLKHTNRQYRRRRHLDVFEIKKWDL